MPPPRLSLLRCSTRQLGHWRPLPRSKLRGLGLSGQGSGWNGCGVFLGGENGGSTAWTCTFGYSEGSLGWRPSVGPTVIGLASLNSLSCDRGRHPSHGYASHGVWAVHLACFRKGLGRRYGEATVLLHPKRCLFHFWGVIPLQNGFSPWSWQLFLLSLWKLAT